MNEYRRTAGFPTLLLDLVRGEGVSLASANVNYVKGNYFPLGVPPTRGVRANKDTEEIFTTENPE